jgi:nitrate/nitrite transporter NarK
LPKYLEFERGFQGQALGWLAGFPMLLCVLADLSGGLAADRATKRWGLRWGRAVVCATGFAVGSAAMLVGIRTVNPWLSAVCIGIAAASTAFPLGAIWSTCTQLGGRQAGLAGGLMNTAGQVGGFLCPIVIGHMRQHYLPNWTLSLYLIAGFFAVGCLCWLLIDVKHSIEEVTA